MPTPLTKLAAEVKTALATAHEAEEKLTRAGLELLKQVGAAAAMTRGDRRGRTSAESHIARLLERAGDVVDLDKFQRDLEERPHLWPATRRALYRIEQEHIIAGWWRNSQPPEEDNLRRAAADYSLDEDTALANELTRAGLNAFHLAGLGFRRAGVAHPELFGTLTYQEEGREIEDALALISSTAELLRDSPALLEAACNSYRVQRRPGVDPVPDLIDAATAEHHRTTR